MCVKKKKKKRRSLRHFGSAGHCEIKDLARIEQPSELLQQLLAHFAATLRIDKHHQRFHRRRTRTRQTAAAAAAAVAAADTNRQRAAAPRQHEMMLVWRREGTSAAAAAAAAAGQRRGEGGGGRGGLGEERARHFRYRQRRGGRYCAGISGNVDARLGGGFLLRGGSRC